VSHGANSEQIADELDYPQALGMEPPEAAASGPESARVERNDQYTLDDRPVAGRDVAAEAGVAVSSFMSMEERAVRAADKSGLQGLEREEFLNDFLGADAEYRADAIAKQLEQDRDEVADWPESVIDRWTEQDWDDYATSLGWDRVGKATDPATPVVAPTRPPAPTEPKTRSAASIDAAVDARFLIEGDRFRWQDHIRHVDDVPIPHDGLVTIPTRAADGTATYVELSEGDWVDLVDDEDEKQQGAADASEGSPVDPFDHARRAVSTACDTAASELAEPDADSWMPGRDGDTDQTSDGDDVADCREPPG
jgi:hypothetical protein